MPSGGCPVPVGRSAGATVGGVRGAQRRREPHREEAALRNRGVASLPTAALQEQPPFLGGGSCSTSSRRPVPRRDKHVQPAVPTRSPLPAGCRPGTPTASPPHGVQPAAPHPCAWPSSLQGRRQRLPVLPAWPAAGARTGLCRGTLRPPPQLTAPGVPGQQAPLHVVHSPGCQDLSPQHMELVQELDAKASLGGRTPGTAQARGHLTPALGRSQIRLWPPRRCGRSLGLSHAIPIPHFCRMQEPQLPQPGHTTTALPAPPQHCSHRTAPHRLRHP